MKMKKSISLLCCVIIASMGIILTGCGNSSNNKDSENSGEKYADSPYVGTWEAKVAEYEGVKYDAEEAIGGASLMIEEDGTAIYFGGGTRIDDKWEPTEDGLKLWKEGETEDDPSIFVYKDDMLIVDVETEGELMTLYFEREDDSDKDTESSSDKDTENSGEKYADSPYVGTWELTAADFNGEKIDDVKEYLGDTYMILDADGTFTYMSDGEEGYSEWKPTEDGMMFWDETGEYSFVYKEEMLVVDVEAEDGVVTEYFKKVD